MRLRLSLALIVAYCNCGSVEPYLPAGTVAPINISVPTDVAAGSYHVRVVFPNANTEQKCDAPCTLNIPAGSNQFIVTGRHTFYQTMIVPPRPLNARIKELNATQLIVGATLAVVGLVGLTAAVIATDYYNKETQKLIDMGRLADSDVQDMYAKQSLITCGVFGGIGIVGSIVALTTKKNRIVLEGALSNEHSGSAKNYRIKE